MDTLGKYRLEQVLGRGAMGQVYRAVDTDIDQIVAIKTLRKDTLEELDDGSLLQRFKNEALAGRRLKHPNIVSIYDYGEIGDACFIVMEYVQGKRLREYFRENYRFETDEIFRIMEQLLRGLGYAHEHGVVHRDVNPANLIVSPDGTVSIMDFGIARLDTSTLTRTGMVLGTPAYMSPEQCLGQPVDPRSDLFSAGIILYQLLCGERPFGGESAMATMQQVLHAEPMLPSLLDVRFPAGVDTVVRKALAKRPDDRYESASQFLAALLALRAPRANEKPLTERPARQLTGILPARAVEKRAETSLLYDLGTAVFAGVAMVALIWFLLYSIAPLFQSLLSASSTGFDPTNSVITIAAEVNEPDACRPRNAACSKA